MRLGAAGWAGKGLHAALLMPCSAPCMLLMSCAALLPLDLPLAATKRWCSRALLRRLHALPLACSSCPAMLLPHALPPAVKQDDEALALEKRMIEIGKELLASPRYAWVEGCTIPLLAEGAELRRRGLGGWGVYGQGAAG